MARDQEGEDVGRAKEKKREGDHCSRRQEATKGGSCAACKCTDKKGEEREKTEKKIGGSRVLHQKSERTRTTAKFSILDTLYHQT